MVIDHFNNDTSSKNSIEANKVSFKYVNDWEQFHHSFTGVKRPEDLKICYLSGPEPSNDFDELLSLGIHSQNIWAFENDKSVYQKAIKACSTSCFPFPKIFYGSIENFFKFTPKKFDIVYIDACGSIPISEQHSLRIISSLIKFHRLESPGIIITNFALPDITKPEVLNRYSNLIAPYLFLKDNLPIKNQNKFNNVQELDIVNFTTSVSSSFDSLYGHFITRLIGDISSVIVPAQRFANSNYCYMLTSMTPTSVKSRQFTLNDIGKIRGDAVFKSLLLYEIAAQSPVSSLTYSDFNKLLEEFMGIDKYKYNAIDSLNFLNMIKNNKTVWSSKLDAISDIFSEPITSYQFLDKPNANLLFDVIINQLSYPMHYNADKSKSYSYTAKQTRMFTDIFVFDECRYIYEWLPTIDIINNAWRDLSWQYTFRFALDGLVKQRIKYNDDYFYQGSVVSEKDKKLGAKVLPERKLFIGRS